MDQESNSQDTTIRKRKRENENGNKRPMKKKKVDEPLVMTCVWAAPAPEEGLEELPVATLLPAAVTAQEEEEAIIEIIAGLSTLRLEDVDVDVLIAGLSALHLEDVDAEAQVVSQEVAFPAPPPEFLDVALLAPQALATTNSQQNSEAMGTAAAAAEDITEIVAAFSTEDVAFPAPPPEFLDVPLLAPPHTLAPTNSEVGSNSPQNSEAEGVLSGCGSPGSGSSARSGSSTRSDGTSSINLLMGAGVAISSNLDRQ